MDFVVDSKTMQEAEKESDCDELEQLLYAKEMILKEHNDKINELEIKYGEYFRELMIKKGNVHCQINKLFYKRLNLINQQILSLHLKNNKNKNKNNYYNLYNNHYHPFHRLEILNLIIIQHHHPELHHVHHHHHPLYHPIFADKIQ